MEDLIAKQERHSGHIIRAFENLKKAGQANMTRGVVEARIGGLDEKWNTFLETHEEIEAAADAADRKLPYFKDDVYTATEDGYYLSKGKFLDLLHKFKGDDTPLPRSGAAAAQQLPKIPLPKFSGDFADWQTFRDLFTSMVKDNDSIAAVEKLHYLKLSLAKEPAALLASLPIAAENLDSAWRILTNRYENVRLLAHAQIANIFALAPMKTESSAELKSLFNGTVSAVSALKALGRPVDSYDDFLVYITVLKLDKQSRREWKTSISGTKTPPTFAELQTFLENRICTVQALEPYISAAPTGKPSNGSAGQPKIDSKSNSQPNRVKSHQASNASDSKRKCTLCKQEHFIAYCDAFRAQSPDERKAFVLSNSLCLNCLGRHFVRECKSQRTCQTCKSKHHTMIHEASSATSRSHTQDQGVPRTDPPQSSSLGHESTVPGTALSSHNARDNGSRSPARVLLATAVVNVLTAGGTRVLVRALLDQGSEASFVSESLVQRLRLPRSTASVAITGIGATSTTTSRGRVSLTISSRLSSNFELRVDALILPRLTSYAPPPWIAGAHWPHLTGLNLADPDTTSSLRIELLLGADAFSQLLLPGLKKGPADAPVAQNTHLGWIISGRVTPPHVSDSSYASLQLSLDHTLSSSLQRFWEQEETAASLPLSAEDERCEAHFASTHSRDSTGRYIVRLPLKGPLSNLGDSYTAASRVLDRIKYRARRDEKFKAAYTGFLTEYEDLGHMEAVSPGTPDPPLVYYLPHHGVIRESSETTKFRVVFNGSQKTSLGISLNDCLHVGPKLLPELVDIMLRWRTHAIVFSADMEKMFRQVLLHPLDRDLQRILWGKTSPERPDAYRLCTVTYGLACAPYLALRVVQQLALDEKTRFPRGSDALLSDVYVDDVLSGSGDVVSALALQREVIGLLEAGGFSLRKWTSSSPELLTHLPPSALAAGSDFVVPNESAFHMLGLSWQADSDSFVFKLKTSEPSMPLTKRKVLSDIAELFDPLGWLAPVTVWAKIFMQALWLLKLEWDQPLPRTESNQWLAFYADLACISVYRIPRWLRLGTPSHDVELHGFADASERAFAAVVYICVVDTTRCVTLVAAKSKVAPVKQVSLPRLELCAAQLLVKLTKHVYEVLDLSCPVHLWSDSTVTLAWIRGHPVRWKTYVANCVSEIQRTLPAAVWHHVESQQNPADCASRGLSASELAGHALWWTGPQWLSSSPEDWPVSLPREPKDPPEQRIASHATTEKHVEPAELLSRYSSLSRLQRVTAWCRRFLKNTRIRAGEGLKARQLDSTLVPTELADALACLLKLEQMRFFGREIAALRTNKAILRGPLPRLNPFLDGNGQLRVGGRLKHALLDSDEKHPIIMPRDSPLTPLLVDHAHRQTLHGGTQLTLATLRQRFWIISGRSAVKTFIGRCIPCLRFRAATASQIMGNLPRERVTRARPFYNRPVLIRTSKGRGHKSSKAYIAVFVCFSTRAVHLEAVSDYSTDGFLAAYRRFTSRRGLCKTLTSDCGTNFVGADAELRDLFSSASSGAEKIQVALANDGVEWRFNPPATPHFGGLWEAAVKSVKHHLRRVLGDSTLTFEEISTLLSQIEACLNSRPLQALTDDPDDLDALTPGHFLIGGPLSSVPEPNLEQLPTSRLSRWQMVQQMRDSFWTRWASEYLHQLQALPKWHKAQPSLQIGDLVLITNELAPPTKWPLARIVEVHPGDDGRVRVATVRTATSTFKRPIVKLCLLAKSASSDETME